LRTCDVGAFGFRGVFEVNATRLAGALGEGRIVHDGERRVNQNPFRETSSYSIRASLRLRDASEPV
jgi:hypothetical protein